MIVKPELKCSLAERSRAPYNLKVFFVVIVRILENVFFGHLQ